MSGGQEGMQELLAPLVSLPGDRARSLLETVRSLSDQELTWLSGYSAGVAAGRAATGPGNRAATSSTLVPVAPAAAAATHAPVTIVFGTHSGTSRKLAEQLARQLESGGVTVRLVRASDYQTRELAKEKLLMLVVATHGDGDPADDTRAFYDFVLGRRAPRLPDLRFAVLGLGDASYPKFCHVARQLDERLASLGATRLAPRGECDVDFETIATPWLAQAHQLLLAEAAPARDGVVIQLRSSVAAGSGAVSASAVATRSQPSVATVLVNQPITARDAGKRVLHLELAVDERVLAYQTGDAIGIWPHNAPWQVDELINTLHLRADTPVTRGGKEHTLFRWLTSELEITKLSRPVLAAIAERTSAPGLIEALRQDNDLALADLLANRQVVDILQQYPPLWTASELVAALRPLAPRSYSIASSPLAFPGEAHLTVAHVSYSSTSGQRRAGAASDYLARANLDDALRAFIEPNPSFRLPSPDTDIMMIGPGTGIAPFRAFLQERELTGGRGKNWLFFGEQHRRSQFLYQLEWQAAVKRGTLHRIDLAFSRDQSHKVYVQHRLLQRGRDVYAWLNSGTHLYICGDAKRMAPDVEAALLSIAQDHGGKDPEGAAEWLGQLRAEGRYHRDVY
jgi:sulfite reductase (NADPH) flavoprotein alpha-component